MKDSFVRLSGLAGFVTEKKKSFIRGIYRKYSDQYQ